MCERYRNVELRKLPFGSLSRVIDVLETNHDWKTLMSIIPKYPQKTNFEPKYNNEHIRLIENHSRLTGRKCTAILLEEWGTSGKIRPTLNFLKELLMKCEMFRAADEIAAMLNEPAPQRPTDGPAASIDTDVSVLLNNESIEQKLNAMDSETNISNSNLYTEDNNINNKTTAQMKSVSNFIQFSNCNLPTISNNTSYFTPEDKKRFSNYNKVNNNMFSQRSTVDVETGNVPNLHVLKHFGNQTTAQMKSESDLIKFSQDSTENVQSANIPNITALLSQSNYNIPTINVADNPKSNSQLSESIDTESSIIATNPNNSSANLYQMSFPNIDLSTNDNETNKIDNAILQNANLINFKYQQLQQMTNNFSEQISVGPNGITGKIGMGGFGEVFVGVHPTLGTLAVKKAHNQLLNNQKCEMTIKVFNAEIKYLSQFQHKNIVPILGFSGDGPAPCIVCEFIDGGSLEHKIAAKTLNEIQRMNIMKGTAEGLKYLHRSESYEDPESEDNAKKNNFVHGDVKSANILLTNDCVPKLCDFGVAKQYDTTFITTSPMGTSAYMAPEGFSGTITQKIDIYSFGIVLLELLTGLKSIVVTNKEQINIRDYVEENSVDGNITHLLDTTIPNWGKANEIYELANACLRRDRRKRLAIENVCDILDSIKIE